MFDARQNTLSGSYNSDDVILLLKKVDLTPTDVAEKERLIQSGQVHYSAMISEERRPDARYMDLFNQAWERGNDRIAADICSLAKKIIEDISTGSLPTEITLCSLVRAGLPYGVLLQRELVAQGVDSVHFGISIIRDKGLDANAMRKVTAMRPAEGVIFVDGWTGKGAISGELTRSWKSLSGLRPNFLVLADPSGYATYAGSHEDWLIPSGILGANVSGLISRSILNEDLIGPEDYHGYIPVDHLADIDVSLAFVDRVSASCEKQREGATACAVDPKASLELRETAMTAVRVIAGLYGVTNMNRIKPGIAEATRAILRRKPRKVFVRAMDDPDLSALIHLCETDGVEIEVAPDLTGPYRAITLIEKV
jgi:hypothetical protein